MGDVYGLYIEQEPGRWRRLGGYGTPTEVVEEFRSFVSAPKAARNLLPIVMAGNMVRGREMSSSRQIIAGPMDRLIKSGIAQ